MTGTSYYRPHVLFVCTANLCRSPAAEFLARDAASRAGIGAEFSSAGTQAVAGAAMHPKTAAFLARRAISTEPWESTRVSADLLADADLVLAATTDHLYALGATLSSSAPRSFTLLQFARLADSMTAEPVGSADEFAGWLQDAVGSARSHTVPSADLDITDPVGYRTRRFDRCLHTVQAAVDRALTALPTAGIE